MQLHFVCRMTQTMGWALRFVLLSSGPQQMGQAPLGAVRFCGASQSCSSIAIPGAASAEKQLAEGKYCRICLSLMPGPFLSAGHCVMTTLTLCKGYHSFAST